MGLASPQGLARQNTMGCFFCLFMFLFGFVYLFTGDFMLGIGVLITWPLWWLVYPLVPGFPPLYWAPPCSDRLPEVVG